MPVTLRSHLGTLALGSICPYKLALKGTPAAPNTIFPQKPLTF